MPERYGALRTTSCFIGGEPRKMRADVWPRGGYSPRHSGGRLRANALIPSRMSREANERARSSINSCSTSPSSSPSERSSAAITRLLPSWASGALPASSPASSPVSASRSSPAATRLTRPQLSAVCASMYLPSRNSSRVRGAPIVSMNRRSPVWEYTSPSFAGGIPSLIASPATRRSHASASSSPPPIVWPGSAATVGHGNAWSASIAAVNGCATSACARSSNASSGISPMSYPAENMPCAPVTTTHTTRDLASPTPPAPACSPSVAVIASRIGWSSALRLSGLEIVSRSTPPAGSSISSLPSASSRVSVVGGIRAGRVFQDDQRAALVDRLALLAADLRDRARVFGLDRHLHLHRLEDRDSVALRDLVSHLTLDLPYGARYVGLHVSHAVCTSRMLSLRCRWQGRAQTIIPRPDPILRMTTDTFIVVAALDEAERIGATLAALALAFPGAPVWVADDCSSDATPELARAAGATVIRSAHGAPRPDGGAPRPDGVVGKGQAMTAGGQAGLSSVDLLNFFDGVARAGPRARGADDLEDSVTGRPEPSTGEPFPTAMRSAAEPIVVLCDGDLGESARELTALVDRSE